MSSNYHKINSVYKRDEKGRLVIGDWSMPEYAYLQDAQWEFTEKVDGTNIRVKWSGIKHTNYLHIQGKTDDSSVPEPIRKRIHELLTIETMDEVFPDASDEVPVVLHGEGYGKGIGKMGKLYDPNGVQFVLFDVFYGLWLERRNVEDIAKKLEIRAVPIKARMPLGRYMGSYADKPVYSSLYEGFAEGVVGRPAVELHTRRGERIITKIKTKDFLR